MTQAVLTPDGRYAVTARYGEAVRVWDMNTGNCVHVLPTPGILNICEGEVMCLVSMPDSQGVVFATQDGRIHVWRFVTGAERYLLPRNDYCNSPQIAISASGERMAFGGWFEPIEVWNILEQRLIKKIDLNPNALTQRLAISRDGSYLVVASGTETLDNQILVLDLASEKVVATYPISSDPAHLSELSVDGKFTCITDDGEVHYLSLENVNS